MVNMKPKEKKLFCTTYALNGAPSKHNNGEKIEINWDLNKTIGIAGASGAGKSTLLRRIAGLDDAVGTKLSINRHSIKRSHRASNPCVYVGADTPLFEHLTLGRNLELAQSMSIWKQPEHAKKLTGLYGFDACESLSIKDVAQLCEIESLLESHCSVLSSGESQRGMLARALLSGKPILLLDEAFSAMDWALRKRLHWRLKHLCAKTDRAIILISHSFRELAVMSDVMLEISEGNVTRQVPTLEYMQHIEGESDTIFSALQEHLRDDTVNNLSVFALTNSKSKVIAKLTKEAEQTNRILLDANALVLSKQSNLKSSMLNCLHGTVADIKAQDKTMAVQINIAGQQVIAQISQKSFSDMQLSADDDVYVYFKAI
jgi:molybdate transport system ATP-binding protein